MSRAVSSAESQKVQVGAAQRRRRRRRRPRPRPRPRPSADPRGWRPEDAAVAAAQAQARCSVGTGQKPCGGSLASEEIEDTADGANHTELENDFLGTSRTTRRKRGKGQSRNPHFGEFSLIFVDISLFYLSHLHQWVGVFLIYIIHLIISLIRYIKKKCSNLIC